MIRFVCWYIQCLNWKDIQIRIRSVTLISSDLFTVTMCHSKYEEFSRLRCHKTSKPFTMAQWLEWCTPQCYICAGMSSNLSGEKISFPYSLIYNISIQQWDIRKSFTDLNRRYEILCTKTLKKCLRLRRDDSLSNAIAEKFLEMKSGIFYTKVLYEYATKWHLGFSNLQIMSFKTID